MEYLDIYDEYRIRTGVVKRRGDTLADGEYIMIVHVCVMNSAGEMLIQQRSRDKNLYAGIWDLSAGGYSQTGETSLQAASRELREELGLSDLAEPVFLFTEKFLSVFDDMYSLKMDADLSVFKPQEGEVEQFAWATREEVLEMLRKGDFVDYPEKCIREIFSRV